MGLGLKVRGLGFGGTALDLRPIQGLGFGIQVLGFRVSGFVFRGEELRG